METKSPFEITLDQMTPEQRELAIRKTDLIKEQIPWVLKHIEGKNFPKEAGISLDNLGTWFARTIEGKHRLQIICTTGKGVMMNYVHQEGGTAEAVYFECNKMFTDIPKD